MLCTVCLHQYMTLSSAYNLSPPAPGQGGAAAALSTLKALRDSCPDQQRVPSVGKLSVAAPHFQAAGTDAAVHAAGETRMPYSTNRESQPSPDQFPSPVTKGGPTDFPLWIILPWVINTKRIFLPHFPSSSVLTACAEFNPVS